MADHGSESGTGAGRAAGERAPPLVDWAQAARAAARQAEQVSDLLIAIRPGTGCVLNWPIYAALEHAHAALLQATVALIEADARERARGGTA